MRHSPDAEALRAAVAEERSVVSRLMKDAEPLADGKAAVLDRVRDTLHAAAADTEVAERVREGRLVREERAVGIGGAVPARTGKRPGGRAKKGPDRRERELRARLTKAQAATKRAKQATDRAEAAFQKASRKLDAARGALVEREREEREARAELIDRR
jgi:hypothetical protein